MPEITRDNIFFVLNTVDGSHQVLWTLAPPMDQPDTVWLSLTEILQLAGDLEAEFRRCIAAADDPHYEPEREANPGAFGLH